MEWRLVFNVHSKRNNKGYEEKKKSQYTAEDSKSTFLGNWCQNFVFT